MFFFGAATSGAWEKGSVLSETQEKQNQSPSGTEVRSRQWMWHFASHLLYKKRSVVGMISEKIKVIQYTIQYDATRYDTIRYESYDMIRYGATRHDTI